jgi:LysM repeat protein
MERRHFLRNSALILGSFWNLDVWSASGPYKVLRGDTLSGIAHRFNTSVKTLKRLNHLSSDLIKAGQTLNIHEKVIAGLPNETITAIKKAPVNRGKWKHIVIHHSATRQGSAKSFDSAHRRRGMSNGLAYHFLIGNGRGSGDGVLEIGSRWRGQLNGGHVKSSWYNGNSIGICLVGNFQERKPTQKQLATLNYLVKYLQTGGLMQQKLRIYGHKQIKREQTLCPGKYMDATIASMGKKLG